MWLKICNTYEKNIEHQRCSLLQKFYSTVFEKDSDMTTFISKIKNLVYRLNSLDAKRDDKMLILKIVAVLPKKYLHFVSAWKSTETENKTVENLTAKLIGEERRIRPNEP